MSERFKTDVFPVPRRKYRLEVVIEGDQIRDVNRVLTELVEELGGGDLPERRVGGGGSVSYGHHYTVDHTMTHERYFELLEQRSHG